MAKKKADEPVAQLVVLKQDLPVETKLTRSEVIDLVMEELEADLNREITELDEQLRENKRLTYDDLAALVNFAGVGSWSNWGGSDVTVSFVVPRHVVGSRLKEEGELHKKLQSLRDKRSELFGKNRTKAKNMILRNFLSSSPEGQDLLELVGRVKVDLRTRLLPDGK